MVCLTSDDNTHRDSDVSCSFHRISLVRKPWMSYISRENLKLAKKLRLSFRNPSNVCLPSVNYFPEENFWSFDECEVKSIGIISLLAHVSQQLFKTQFAIERSGWFVVCIHLEEYLIVPPGSFMWHATRIRLSKVTLYFIAIPAFLSSKMRMLICAITRLKGLPCLHDACIYKIPTHAHFSCWWHNSQVR